MKKRFSKALTLLLAIAMLATQFSVLSFAADGDYCSVCGENAVRGAKEYSIAPTCGNEGFDIYACDYKDKDDKDCAGTITVKVGATNVHKPDGKVVEAVAPTCTEKGSLAYELCTECGCYLVPDTTTKMDSIEVAAKGHSYSEAVTAPECEKEGYTTYTCTNKDKVLVDGKEQEVACGHTYVDNKTAATGHDYSKKIEKKEPTCREDGYEEYYVCSKCGKEDPNRPKKVLPKEDHNLGIVDSKEPTCTEKGYNVFKCEKETCPYFKGITEEIAALGHDEVKHAAQKATCEGVGYDAYVTCNRCAHSTYNKATEVAALGHTYVSTGYKAATCTEEGTSNAIVCDREGCGKVHNKGDVAPALGHKFEAVAKKDPTCTATGNIAHNKCTVCNKTFAADAKAEDITAAPIDVVIPANGHSYESITIAAKCNEKGYTVYTCTVDGCGHTYSEEIAATGHTFKKVDEVPAKCEQAGTKAHNECTVCKEKFAIDADPTDISIKPATDLAIKALEHVYVPAGFNAPTYDAAGNEAGQKCSLCGKFDKNVIAELQEAIKFKYTIEGVNGSDTAVNSGYVVMNIYFDVLADANDKEEWNSDVLANIFGIDFGMNFDKDVFHLTDVEVGLGTFNKAEFTPLDLANTNGSVTISQDMVEGYKVFRGEDNLFATLTFQVDTEAAKGDYAFEMDTDVLNVAHPDGETIATAESETEVAIEVKKLGDANADGKFSVNDTLMISQYIKNPDIAKKYIAEYDMDKDGDIDFIDLDLVRKAIVGNNEYLDIQVDPNQL